MGLSGRKKTSLFWTFPLGLDRSLVGIEGRIFLGVYMIITGAKL